MIFLSKGQFFFKLFIVCIIFKYPYKIVTKNVVVMKLRKNNESFLDDKNAILKNK